MSPQVNTMGEVKFNSVVPQRSQIFLLLSSELSKLQRVPNSPLRWQELDVLCQRIFSSYGYDLHTGAWYCLIQLRMNGWSGLAKALELLASGLSFAERKVNDDSQRRYALMWFTEYVITPVYVQAQTDTDAESLNRAEMALKVMQKQAHSLQLRGSDMLNNLGYYLQVRGRAGQQIVLDVENSPQMQLICKDVAVEKVAASPELEECAGEAATAPTLIEDLPDRRWRWMAGGIALASALWLVPAAGYLAFKHLSAPHPVLKVLSDIDSIEKQIDSPALLLSPLNHQEIEWVKTKLLLLNNKHPTWLLQQGNRIATRLQDIQPDNSATLAWQQTLKAGSGDLSRAQGWFDVQQRLNLLEQRLLESEKTQRNHITISELKTDVYEMKQALKNMDVPVSVLLWAQQQGKSKPTGEEQEFRNIEQQVERLTKTFLLLNQ